MKLLQALLFLAPAHVLGQAPSARSYYTETCPSQDGLSASFTNGPTVKYHCCKTAPASNLIHQKQAATPEICASLCHRNSQCRGAAWLYSQQVCQLFSHDGPPNSNMRGAIYMEKEDPPRPDPGQNQSRDCADVQNALSDCEASETELTTQLGGCQQTVGGLQTSLDDCNEEKNQFQRDLETESELRQQCLNEKEQQKQLCDSEKESLNKELEALRAAQNKPTTPPPCTQRSLRTVTITSQGYYQNGGYLPDNKHSLVVSWQSGNTQDVWAIHDDLGPLPVISPYPRNQQKTREFAVCGRVHCPSAPQVSFHVA